MYVIEGKGVYRVFFLCNLDEKFKDECFKKG